MTIRLLAATLALAFAWSPTILRGEADGARQGPEPTEAGAALDPGQLAAAAAGWQQPGLYPPAPMYPGEEGYLSDLRQLTFGGQNAEAYFSPDGSRLLLQSTRDGYGADQIYLLDLATLETRLVSTGKGVTTCSYWLSDGRRFVYASTHLEMPGEPASPDYSLGYVWPLHASYEIFIAAADTGEILERVTDSPGYDAELEGVDWRRGNRMVFTSSRAGDLDLYALALDGDREVTRLTYEVGYDGGSFPGYSGEFIVWRRSTYRSPEEIEDFRRLLARALVRPSALEIMIMRADGTHRLQLTANGAANFGPVLSPDDSLVMYASNVGDPGGRDFDLWLHDLPAGTDERVTRYPGFDGFPMWSPDGRWIVFGSNRNGLVVGETNLFLARWTGPDPGSFSLAESRP